jgi:glycosyltransferase involved in cell wall biosynthesis
VIPLLIDLETEWRGGQNQMLLTLKGLHARGHAAELVGAAGSVLGKRAQAAGVRVHTVSRGALRIPAALKIFDMTKTGRFDLVHVNEAHGLTAAWLARAHRRLPLIVSRRVGYPLGKSRIAQARYKAATRIVAISHWVARQLADSGVRRDQMAVVYEGVEIPPPPSGETRAQARSRWSISPDTPLLGNVGVLLPDKGQEWLVRALATIRKEFGGCRLLLAGDGPCRPRLEKLTREKGLTEAVIFAGFVEEIETVYAALDVFLFPAQFEGLGTSLLAAMSYGIPSIAFKGCAFGEIIEDGKSGILVETESLPGTELAITRLLREQKFARSMGAAGRARIEEVFSADRMVEETLKVYEEVCTKK